MSEDIFKNIIKNTYNFDDKEDKKCVVCGNSIEDFTGYSYVYDYELCECCFEEAEEDRLR